MLSFTLISVTHVRVNDFSMIDPWQWKLLGANTPTEKSGLITLIYSQKLALMK